VKAARRPWPFFLATAIGITLYIITWAHAVKQDIQRYEHGNSR